MCASHIYMSPQETAVAAVATISQLLTANPEEFTGPNEATLG